MVRRTGPEDGPILSLTRIFERRAPPCRGLGARPIENLSAPLRQRRLLKAPNVERRRQADQPQAGRQGRSAERAVQAGARLLHPRARPPARARDRLFGRQAVPGRFARGRQGAAARAAAQAQSARGGDRARASPIRSRCASPATTTRSTGASRRRARPRAPCSTRSSRRGSKPSARAACRAWLRTSPRCSTTATIAARSRKRAPARRRRWRMRWRCWRASA